MATKKRAAKRKAKANPKATRKKARAKVEAPRAYRTPRPARVTGEAARVWDDLAPIMEQCGRLDENTAPAFVYLCQVIADFEMAKARVDALGDDVVLENSNGTMSMHPFEKIRQSRSREQAAALKEWGLTPASLGRLGVTGLPPQEQDEHAAFEAL